MSFSSMTDLLERLVEILGHPEFLAMRGLGNEVPLFIQPYDPAKEDELRRTVDSVASRLRTKGLTVVTLDLFDLVLEELEENRILQPLIEHEPTFKKEELLETLQNYSDPETHLVPRLVAKMSGEGTQLALITGSGRVYPFLRTHAILESLQPRMPNHPVVFFFPGEYVQEPDRGSYLRLFGSAASHEGTYNPYYRAINLEQYRIRVAR